MTLLITSLIFLVIGVSGAIIFFRIRLKKTVQDLVQSISALKSSYSANASELSAALLSPSGTFAELETIGNELSSLRSAKKDPEPQPVDTGKADKSDALQKSYDNLLVVNELGQRVTASLSLNDVFDHLFKTINSMMDAAVFELGVYYWKDNRWQILSNIDLQKNASGEEINYKNHMAEWCLLNHREIILDDAEKEFGRYVFQPLTLPDGRIAQSIISFPIYQNERERGTISVISFRKNAFNNYHIEMIRSLIPYVAVALDNALVHQELIVTQNQLIHNEKMASIGQLSSGIAHEILNPLNFVNNFSELSIELFDEYQKSLATNEHESLKEQLVNNLDKINFHGNRAYTIVKNMMQLTRSGDGEKTNVYINKHIQDSINISYEGFKIKYKGFDCRIETILDPQLPVKKMVAEEFTRVLINVFSNAFYAMNEKRKKLSESKNQSSLEAYEPELIIKTSVTNSIIKITVRDNGSGVPDEIKGKIFLPFFTTKPTGEGTGLGLSLSHDIITKGNQGEISVESEPGRWTEFKIELPLV